MVWAGRWQAPWALLGLYLRCSLASGREAPVQSLEPVSEPGSCLLQRGNSFTSLASPGGALAEDEGHVEGPPLWTVTVIIDSNFLQVWDCWWNSFRSSGSHVRVHVRALDAAAYTALQSQWWGSAGQKADGATAYELIDPSTVLASVPPVAAPALPDVGISPRSFLEVFWKTMRMSIVSSRGGSIHSDADALWVRSPDKMLQGILRRYPEVDIVSQVSYGATWHEAFQQWGFVLNTGFTLFRNTPAVLAMIDTFVSVAQTRLEQGVLNEYLLQRGCVWSKEHRNDSKTATMGRCGELTVVLLPNHQVSREELAGQNLTVYHPDLRRTPLVQLRSQGYCGATA